MDPIRRRNFGKALTLAAAFTVTLCASGAAAAQTRAQVLTRTAKQLGAATVQLADVGNRELALHVLAVHGGVAAGVLGARAEPLPRLAKVAMLAHVTGMTLDQAAAALAGHSFGHAVRASGASMRHAQITLTAAVGGANANTRAASHGLADSDDDGTPDLEDDDVDGDGLANGDDEDEDGDGIANGDDEDVDGDGIANADDDDVDGDDVANDEDEDIDDDDQGNDEDGDDDGDGIDDDADDDDDGDGTPDGDDDDQGDDDQGEDEDA